MNFKASIVVPVFNSETYISSAIESILNQDEADFQLIIANDGSTDNTLDIINDFRKQDKRIEVYSHKNKGMGETLNEAIEKSKSNIIFRMDSDDIMQSNRIKKQLTFLKKNSDIHFSSCFYELIDEKGNILGRKSSDLVTNKAVKNKLANSKI